MLKMRKILVLTIFLLLTYSCSTTRKASPFLEYHSEKLCLGIRNMTEYIKNSEELKTYFKNILTDSINLKYEIDTVVKEGVPFPFFVKEISTIISQNEKISNEQASIRLYRKFQAVEPLRLNTGCIKNTKISRPEIMVSYWFYPEYGLLISEISEIKLEPKYGQGFLFLAEIGNEGEIKIIAKSDWIE
jgi:hypothetical protein